MMLLEVDPNLVRPGWTPLVVIVLLGVVLFFLGRSMIKQFGRIDVPEADGTGAADESEAAPPDADTTPDDEATAGFRCQDRQRIADPEALRWAGLDHIVRHLPGLASAAVPCGHHAS